MRRNSPAIHFVDVEAVFIVDVGPICRLKRGKDTGEPLDNEDGNVLKQTRITGRPSVLFLEILLWRSAEPFKTTTD